MRKVDTHVADLVASNAIAALPYTQRLARLRRIREHPYVMQVLARDLDEAFQDECDERWFTFDLGLLVAINFLRSNANIEDESLLSSPLFDIMPDVANARGRYSGSSETRLDEDITTLEKGGTATDLLDTVRRRSRPPAKAPSGGDASDREPHVAHDVLELETCSHASELVRER